MNKFFTAVTLATFILLVSAIMTFAHAETITAQCAGTVENTTEVAYYLKPAVTQVTHTEANFVARIDTEERTITLASTRRPVAPLHYKNAVEMDGSYTAYDPRESEAGYIVIDTRDHTYELHSAHGVKSNQDAMVSHISSSHGRCVIQ